MTRMGVFATCLSLLALGCGEAPEEVSTEPLPGEEGSNWVIQTSVLARQDGTFEVRERHVTRQEQQAQADARTARIQRLAENGGRNVEQALDALQQVDCSNGNALWLYSAANRTGNQLCLIKPVAYDMAWLDLGLIYYPVLSNWGGRVRSLWSGEDPGSLQYCTATSCSSLIYVNFSAYQAINSFASSQWVVNWAYLYDP